MSNFYLPTDHTPTNPPPPPLPAPFKPLPFSSKPSARIFVGNIAPFIGLNDLRHYFSRFGKIIDVYAPRATLVAGILKHKGYAFVEFDSPETAMQVRKLAERYNTTTTNSNNSTTIDNPDDNPFILGSRPLIIDRADPRAAPPPPTVSTVSSSAAIPGTANVTILPPSNRNVVGIPPPSNDNTSFSFRTNTSSGSTPFPSNHPLSNVSSQLSLNASPFSYDSSTTSGSNTTNSTRNPTNQAPINVTEMSQRSIYSSVPNVQPFPNYFSVRNHPSYFPHHPSSYRSPSQPGTQPSLLSSSSFPTLPYLPQTCSLNTNISFDSSSGGSWHSLPNVRNSSNLFRSNPVPSDPSFPYLSASSKVSTSSSVSSAYEPFESIEIDKPFELNLLRTIASPTTEPLLNDNFTTTTFTPTDPTKRSTVTTGTGSHYSLPDLSLPFLNGPVSNVGMTTTNTLSTVPPSRADTVFSSSADLTGTVDTPLSWISRSSTPDRLSMVSNILQGITTSSLFDPTNLTVTPNRSFDLPNTTNTTNLAVSVEGNSTVPNLHSFLPAMEMYASVSSSSSTSTAFGSPIAPFSSSSTTSTVHNLPPLNLHTLPTGHPAVSPPTLRPSTIIHESNVSASSFLSTTASPTLSGLSSRDGLIPLERLHGVHWPETSEDTVDHHSSSGIINGSSTTMDRLPSIPISASTTSPIWPPLPPSSSTSGTSVSKPLSFSRSSSPLLSGRSGSTTTSSTLPSLSIEDTSLRIFVGKIGTFTNINTLWTYFLSTLTDLGFTDPQRAIADIYYPYDEHGHPRGFAFVSFTCPAAYQAISSITTHVIEGRTVVIDTAIPRGMKGTSIASAPATTVSNAFSTNEFIPRRSTPAVPSTVNPGSSVSSVGTATMDRSTAVCPPLPAVPSLSSLSSSTGTSTTVSSSSLSSSTTNLASTSSRILLPPSLLSLRTNVPESTQANHPSPFVSPSCSSISGLPSPVARAVNVVFTPRPAGSLTSTPPLNNTPSSSGGSSGDSGHSSTSTSTESSHRNTNN